MLAGWELAAFAGSCEGVFLFCPRKPARKSREKKGKELKPFLHRCEAAATARLAAAKLAGVRVEAVREEEEGIEITFAQVRSGNSGTRSGAKRRHSRDQRRRNLPGSAGFMPVQSAGRNACGRKTPHRTGDAGGGKALRPSHRLASSGTSAPCLAMRRFEALRTAYCPSEISGESASSRA